MPRKLIRVKKKGTVVYQGPNRRKKQRRSGSDRRANSKDFMKSVILGRRQKSMGPSEIADIDKQPPGWSGRRNVAFDHRIGTAVDWDAKQGNPVVTQTTRRRSTTRRSGIERRGKGSGATVEHGIKIDGTTTVWIEKKGKKKNVKKREQSSAHRPWHSPKLIIED
ncbi:MAG: hypothetical protein JW772_02540 [Candidatus Diapherotrites archaeon]|nr:hypothetical protein [Candidatus Diapherotrites archaeon]